MTSIKDQAIKLRDEGYSYKMIGEKLGLSLSTMSYWFKGRPYSPNAEVIDRIRSAPEKGAEIRRNSRILHRERMIQQGIVEVGNINRRDLMMLGIGLYIGEGAKSIESVRIMNSDPLVIKLSIRWLKEVCGLGDDNIMISMFLYPDTDENMCMAYWQRITGLPMSNFRKTSIDRRLDKRKQAKGKLPYGTVQLRVNSNGNREHGVTLFRRIMGWTAGVLGEL